MNQIVPRRKLPPAPAPVVETGVLPADFTRYFNNFIESTKKQWGHDRKKTLGGSEVFGCIRKAWYSRHDTPKDPDYKESWGATKRGDLIENYHVVPAMDHAAENEGFKIDYTGADQQTLFAEDGTPMSVTPDGLIHGVPANFLINYGIKDLQSDCCMFEIKSIDPRVDLSEEKSIHHGQTQIQMGLVRENTKFRPHYAVILYVNASFFDDMKVYIVEWNPEMYQSAKDRARYVYEVTDPSKLLREGVIDNSCDYCPYKGACLQTTKNAMPADKGKAKKGDVTNPKLVESLGDLMERAHKARAVKKKAEKEDGLVKEEIKARLREFNERRAKDANWSVSYGMQDGRATVDKDKIAEAFDRLSALIVEHGLIDELDAALKDAGVGEEGQNELRTLTMDNFMKRGDPFEVIRMTFTEPDGVDE